MCGKFRLHHMTGLSTKLDRFHVLDRAICALRADWDIDGRSHTKKNGQCSQVGLPVRYFLNSLLNALASDDNAGRYQNQARQEDDGDKDENKDANVRIVGVTLDLGRECEQPRETGCRYQGNAHPAHPVRSEQHEDGAFQIVVHS